MGTFINEQHSQIFAETSDIPGWQLPGDSEMLFELAYKFGDVILEIGTYAGRSATVALKGALSARRSPSYYGIDIDGAAINRTVKTLGRFGFDRRAILFEGTAASIVQRFHISPTMVYVDGDHSYEGALSDLQSLSAIVRPGTPVMCHDYLNPDTPGVSRAVDEWVSAGWASLIRTNGCSVLLIASKKCLGGTPSSFLTFYFVRAILFLEKNPQILKVRSIMQLRSRARRIAHYITRRM
jgi:hypothetical protein